MKNLRTAGLYTCTQQPYVQLTFYLNYMKMKKILLKALLVLCIGVLLGASVPKENRLANGTDLVGTWQLVKFKYSGDSLFKDLPGFMIYRKLITPSHFTWVSYDADGDEVSGLGGGTYTLKNGTYIENIEYFYPKGSSLLGSAIPFDCRIENGLWYHAGYIQYREYDAEKDRYVVVNTEKIEEVWKRIE